MRELLLAMTLLTVPSLWAQSQNDLLSSLPIPFWSQSSASYFLDQQQQMKSRVHYFEPAVQQVTGLSPEQIIQIKINFLDRLAKKIISRMQNDPQMLVRLLSRDMDQVFARVVRHLTNEESELSPALRLQILRRIDFAYVSRPLMNAFNTETLKFALKLTDQEIKKASQVLILDLGFHGNLFSAIHRMLPDPDGKIQYALIWRQATAPSFIKTFELSKALAKVAEQAPYYSTPDAQANQGHLSFRVGVIEHGPKWFERITGLMPTYTKGAGVVHLLVDLEDTVLKEVPWERDTSPPLVQIARFMTKDPKLVERYTQRLSAKEPTDQSRIHFQIHQDGSISSKLFLHPSFAELLHELTEPIKRGSVKLWIKSTHDPQRTISIVNGFDWGGFTLADLGAQIIDRALFKRLKKYSVSQVRQSLPIRATDSLIILDSEGRKYAELGQHDQVINTKPLEYSVVENSLSDNRIMTQIQTDIRNQMDAVLDEVRDTAKRRPHPPFAVILIENAGEASLSSRPGMKDFLEQLLAFANKGQAQVYVLPKSQDGLISTTVARASLELPSSVQTLFISDHQSALVEKSDRDIVYKLTAPGPNTELQDYINLRPLIDLLYHSTFQTVDTPADQKQAVLEIMKNPGRATPYSCEKLLQ